jgi:putative transposase
VKAAIRRVMGAAWQRCRVHCMRNAQSYVAKSQQSMVAAGLRQAFIQPDRASASQTLRHVADQLRPKWPKPAAFIDESETDVLAHMDFPAQHRSKIHSTNPIERLNKEVKRRADVVGIFPNEGSIIRLIGAVLLEANDEWQLQHRYMQTEPMAELMTPNADALATQIATMPPDLVRNRPRRATQLLRNPTNTPAVSKTKLDHRAIKNRQPTSPNCHANRVARQIVVVLGFQDSVSHR